MLHFASWSGGKDSTASIILAHIHGEPLDKIVFSEVMFDRRRGISGELPEHINFVKNVAIPTFKKWGYDTEIVHADKDYLDLFYHILRKSRYPERIGRYYGFLIGGQCAASRDLKLGALKKFYKDNDYKNYIQYIGIAADETTRLDRLRDTSKTSLLEKYGVTEKQAYDLCRSYGLLSSVYRTSKRGGCWFCPNSKIREMAHLKLHHPDLWGELEKLSKEKNTVSKKFKWVKSFDDVDCEVDRMIRNKRLESMQTSIYDLDERKSFIMKETGVDNEK